MQSRGRTNVTEEDQSPEILSATYQIHTLESSGARVPGHVSVNPSRPDRRGYKRQPEDIHSYHAFWKVNGKLFDLEVLTVFPQPILWTSFHPIFTWYY